MDRRKKAVLRLEDQLTKLEVQATDKVCILKIKKVMAARRLWIKSVFVMWLLLLA